MKRTSKPKAALLSVKALVDEAMRLHHEDGDFRAAARLYRQAAVRGDLSAMLNLGCLYADGAGVRRSDAQALAWWRKGAKRGDAPCAANVANHYRLTGRAALAERWYWRALRLGAEESALALAKLMLARTGAAATAKVLLQRVARAHAVSEADQEEAVALLEQLDERRRPR